MKQNKFFIIPVLLTVMISCHPASESGKMPLISDKIVAHADPIEKKVHTGEKYHLESSIDLVEANFRKSEGSGAEQQLFSERKVTKTGSLTLQVREIETIKNTIDSIVRVSEAYYESETYEDNDDKTVSRLKIRVLPQYFEKLIAAIEKTNVKVLDKNIDIEDVTLDYSDLESRIATKRAYLKRYTEMLSRADSIEDMIQMEEMIRSLQEDLKSSEVRLKMMRSQISMANLDVSLIVPREFVFEPKEGNPFTERLKESMFGGLNIIQDSVLWIAGQWHVILFLLLLYFLVRRFADRKIRQYLSYRTVRETVVPENRES